MTLKKFIPEGRKHDKRMQGSGAGGGVVCGHAHKLLKVKGKVKRDVVKKCCKNVRKPKKYLRSSTS